MRTQLKAVAMSYADDGIPEDQINHVRTMANRHYSPEELHTLDSILDVHFRKLGQKVSHNNSKLYLVVHSASHVSSFSKFCLEKASADEYFKQTFFFDMSVNLAEICKDQGRNTHSHFYWRLACHAVRDASDRKIALDGLVEIVEKKFMDILITSREEALNLVVEHLRFIIGVFEGLSESELERQIRPFVLTPEIRIELFNKLFNLPVFKENVVLWRLKERLENERSG